MELGKKIRSLREARGITATFIAKKLGYKYVSSYTRLENGDSNISLEQAKKIADILNVDINDFFYKENLRESHKEDSA
ncbi:helix-turn-helix domain-containing protein [Rossellomorea vietnamensis]|uniref:helix-turn-helix domain-containing protein n=1 Tax=Rossellomorea vietnamensis TaxID=218284 RepID=UPI0016538E48|nr:helix-turn-helix transcriptional regulator [Rossellomorea vietnamensis]